MFTVSDLVSTFPFPLCLSCNGNEQQQDTKNKAKLQTELAKTIWRTFKKTFRRGRNRSIKVSLLRDDDDDADDGDDDDDALVFPPEITIHIQTKVFKFISIPQSPSLPTADGTVHCFSTAGPRPRTGPWHQLYRAARGSPGIDN